MNSKMTTNSQLSTTEPKNKTPELSKHYNMNRITEMETTGRVISEEVEGRSRGKGTGNK